MKKSGKRQASDNALIEALKQMTIAQIRQVADTASEEELHFLMDGVEMNERLAAYSEDKKVGVGIADTLRSEKGSEVLKNDLLTRIMLESKFGSREPSGRLSAADDEQFRCGNKRYW